MRTVFMVALGGAIGAVLRYIVSGYVQQMTRSAPLPYGTLAVNVMGCFVIGLLSQAVEYRGIFTSDSRALLFVGVLGSFTTFSTFSNESLDLWRRGEEAFALMNIGVHVGLGLIMIWLGRVSGQVLWGGY
ncbi:MAG: fluoride efflux transporter CrcB [Ardenticatenia bacterium]|nr:fluoride efflux transporter CrcB [Ardenticatenia bacterium]